MRKIANLKRIKNLAPLFLIFDQKLFLRKFQNVKKIHYKFLIEEIYRTAFTFTHPHLPARRTPPTTFTVCLAYCKHNLEVMFVCIFKFLYLHGNSYNEKNYWKKQIN